MNRRTFVGAASGALASGALPGAVKPRRPNVLFIIADEWRAQSTSWNGDPNVETPALGRFARQSVRFENAVSNLPVCCPARASIMTGQYPLTHGVFINDVELKPNGTTLAEAFQHAGYRTGYIGKWHLYGSPDGNYGRRLSPVPTDRRFGFEYWKACECTHDYNHSLYYEGDDPTPRYWPGYDAFAQTDDAVRFVGSNAAKRDPFFLFLSLGPPHFPYETAPEPYRERYRNRPIQLRANVPEAKRAEATDILRGYYAHMAALDGCFDRLLTALERNRIADDTIVVFTSDHGDMMLSQGLTTKLYPWDESVRVPFVVRYPRKLGRAGARRHSPMNMPDVMPTLLGLAGLPIPGEVEGVNRFRADSDRSGPSLLMLPVPITEARRYGIAEYRGIRNERYTYVRSIQGPWLLYDNHADPFQKRNLIGTAEVETLQSEMERALDDELHRCKDEFLPARSYIEKSGLTHYREVNVPIGSVQSPWGDWRSTLPLQPR